EGRRNGEQRRKADEHVAVAEVDGCALGRPVTRNAGRDQERADGERDPERIGEKTRARQVHASELEPRRLPRKEQPGCRQGERCPQAATPRRDGPRQSGAFRLALGLRDFGQTSSPVRRTFALRRAASYFFLRPSSPITSASRRSSWAISWPKSSAGRNA